MAKRALIIMSPRHCATAQETLRVQDTAVALEALGWQVDVLTPRANAVLTLALPDTVRVYELPRVPFVRLALFLRGVSLLRLHGYDVLHGLDDGAAVARWVDRVTMRKFAYIAEVHHPVKNLSTMRHAAAVIVAEESELACFAEPPPKARVSILPDPHAELVPESFTMAEYREALDKIYRYVLRDRT